jgi:hypothetical protein
MQSVLIHIGGGGNGSRGLVAFQHKHLKHIKSKSGAHKIGRNGKNDATFSKCVNVSFENSPPPPLQENIWRGDRAISQASSNYLATLLSFFLPLRLMPFNRKSYGVSRTTLQGISLAKLAEQAFFTSEIVSLHVRSILAVDSLHLYVKRVSQRNAKSRGFSPGTPFLHQGNLDREVRLILN